MTRALALLALLALPACFGGEPCLNEVKVIVFAKPDSHGCWAPARLYVEHLPGGTSALIHCVCPERKP